MKRKLSTWAIGAVGFALLCSFILGLVWSLLPVAGDTLPHHFEAWSGISFAWSALLVSSLLGLLCASSIVLLSRHWKKTNS